MPTIGDVIQLTAEGTYGEKPMYNVYGYVWDDDNSLGITLLEFVEAWRDVFLSGIVAAQVTSVLWTKLRAVNVTTGTEAVDLPVSVSGGITTAVTEQAAQFLAYSVTLSVGGGNTRPGFKRIAGVSEDAMTQYGAIDTAWADYTDLTNMATLLGYGLYYDGTDWTAQAYATRDAGSDGGDPIVIGVDTTGNLDPTRFSYIQVATLNAVTTTQNSRK